MRKNALLAAFTLLTAGAVQAAVITWGAATSSSSSTDVVNTGTTVEAFNGYVTGNTGNISTTSPTINGVSFTGSSTLLDSDTSTNTDNYGGDTGDSGYNDLLSSVDFGGGDSAAGISPPAPIT